MDIITIMAYHFINGFSRGHECYRHTDRHRQTNHTTDNICCNSFHYWCFCLSCATVPSNGIM